MNEKHNRRKLIRRKFLRFFPNWHFVEYVLLRGVMALVNFFPIRVSTWIARRAGDVMYFALPQRRRVAFSNISIAFRDTKTDREKKKIAKEAFRNLITSFMEFFRLPKLLRENVKRVSYKGDEHIDNALKKGKGFILAISHLGPWEYIGIFSYFKQYDAAIVGRALRNPYLYKWIRSLREKVKLEYIDKDVSLKRVLTKIKENKGVAIAIDQWAGNEGIWIDFFGKKTSTTSFPARLVRKTGCALIPANIVRTGSGKYEVHVESDIAFEKDDPNWVEKATKKLNSVLEDKIRAYPGQWIWTHKRWKPGKNIKKDLALQT